MANITEIPQQVATNIQKVGKKPKFRVPWAFGVVALSVLILLGAGVVFAFQKIKAPPPVTNTGADVHPTPPPANDPYVELGKLLDKGDFGQAGFSVKKVTDSTSIAVFLDSPYDQSQLKFAAWLIANGFGDIPKDKIVYFHNP